jgi:hypothetical protein
MPHRSHGHGQGHLKAPLAKRALTFSKVFRWQPSEPGGPAPACVEVVGSFTDWQPVALKHDRATGGWQVTLNNIPGNRTHSYMLLVNRQPVSDKHADGLAVPHTPEEQQHQLMTPRGPRVFMLYSQTK